MHFEYDTADFADVAGLTNLKAWLDRRRNAILGQGQGRGPPARASCCWAYRAAARAWPPRRSPDASELPLLRLDFGALYDKYIGETEKNLQARPARPPTPWRPACCGWTRSRRAWPAAGTTTASASGVLGTLLTWMAERKSAVFIVATANDISRLPPELVRKGRFDEIFFVDLPGPPRSARAFSRSIWATAASTPPSFDLERLADASEGFSGAEIEQAVVSALYATQAKDEPWPLTP